MRIMLVEDDTSIGQGLKKWMTNKGLVVDWFTDGQSALYGLDDESYDAVILDIGLPKLSGIDFLAAARAQGDDTPILILTARDSTDDQIKGLELGADQYIVKPIDPNILMAKIIAVKRRAEKRSTSSIHINDVRLDPHAHQVYIGQQPVTLSRREFHLIHKLMSQADQIVSRETLSQTLYGWNQEIESNTIEVHVHNIRKKFKNHLLIKTIRGLGYQLSSEKPS